MNHRPALALTLVGFILGCDTGPQERHVPFAERKNTPQKASAAPIPRAPAMTTQPPAKATVPVSSKPAATTAYGGCQALNALDSRVGETKPLPRRYCAAIAPDAANECPRATDIAVVLDHDSETAATSRWTTFVDDLTAIAATCEGGEDPLDGRLPASCDTIQRLGENPQRALGSCRRSGATFPRRTPSGGAKTPVVQAVQSLCRRIESRVLGVGVLGFDGVPDGDYQDATPAAAFAEQIGQCAADGTAISMVAQPEQYRYVYVLAQDRYRLYAERLAQHLADRWTSTGRPAVAFHTTPTPSQRNALAAATFDRNARPVGRWDNSTPAITRLLMDGIPVGERIDALNWAVGGESRGAAFRLQWNATPVEWQRLAASGLSLAHPKLFVNQEVTNLPGSPFTNSPNANIARLENCNSYRDPNTPLMETRCGRPSPQFFQRLAVADGRADIELFRGPDHNWLRSATKDPAAVTAVRSSGGKPSLSIAVVSPAYELDPCLVPLGRALRSSHRWQRQETTASKLVGARQACAYSPLRTLVERFGNTAYSSFSTTSEIHAGTADRRVGMESSVASLRAIAEAHRRKPSADACVVRSFRVDFQSCQPPSSVALSATD